MRTLAAILLGKTVIFLTKFLRFGGGSAAPGLYALKIDPALVTNLSQKIPKNIVITGTNGKTTTARMLSHFAKEAGLKVIRNHTGSNLERGIASALISDYTLNPRPLGKAASYAYPLDLGIWELDEAAFNTIAPKLNPGMIVFLNVFRDQLDRYGEIDTVIKNWCRTLSKIDPDTKIFINGDDHNLAILKDFFKGKIQTFGLESNKISGEKTTKYKNTIKLDFEAINIIPKGLEKIDFTIDNQKFNIPLPGFYHIYNFLAAYALSQEIKISIETIRKSLKNFSPAFGRVEKLPFGYIFLIKNPTGATQVLQTLAPNIKPQDRLLLALNDKIADGTDVSWIWDIDFEKCKVQNTKYRVFCSGSRAYDLALRLKYAGFETTIEPDLEKALKQARIGLKGQLFILPTYTAMLELQSILAKQGLKKKYWEEA